jgi:predicted metal-binding membrane protein
MRDDESLPILTKIAREGLFIGGWIFIWEAFSLFFFTTHDERKRRDVFYRYLDSEIYFKESKE